MAVCVRTSTEQTIALQSFSNLTPGERYHVQLKNEDFIGFLMYQRGPFMFFICEDHEYKIGPLDIERIQQI